LVRNEKKGLSRKVILNDNVRFSQVPSTFEWYAIHRKFFFHKKQKCCAVIVLLLSRIYISLDITKKIQLEHRNKKLSYFTEKKNEPINVFGDTYT